jgi:hypothetical protein
MIKSPNDAFVPTKKQGQEQGLSILSNRKNLSSNQLSEALLST